MDIITEQFVNGKGADLKFLNKTAKCKYINHMESLLKDGKFTDLIVNVEDKEFHVHKAILCARSPVFAAMFEHETKEQDENRINIHGIEEDVFEVLLYHIYTGKVQSLELYAAELFTAADMVSRERLWGTYFECSFLYVVSIWWIEDNLWRVDLR